MSTELISQIANGQLANTDLSATLKLEVERADGISFWMSGDQLRRIADLQLANYDHSFAVGCAIAGSSAKTFTFAGPGVDYSVLAEVQIMGYFAGNAALTSGREKRSVFYVFTNSMAANNSSDGFTLGSNFTDLTLAWSAVGSGNQFRLTVTNGNAGAFSGVIRFRLLSVTQFDIAAPT